MQRAWQEWEGADEERRRGDISLQPLGVPSRDIQRLCEKIKTLRSREGPTPRHTASDLESLGLTPPGWAPGPTRVRREPVPGPVYGVPGGRTVSGVAGWARPAGAFSRGSMAGRWLQVGSGVGPKLWECWWEACPRLQICTGLLHALGEPPRPPQAPAPPCTRG